MIRTVSFTAANDLCISCGICAAVCPVKCITFSQNGGMYLPVVNEELCCECGKCFAVCPGKGTDYRGLDNGLESILGLGSALGIYTVKTRNKEILRNAVSGGAVTEIISGIFDMGLGYKSAFVVRGHNYDEPPETEIVNHSSELYASQKSRYVIVSHRECAEYIITHPDEKIILAGTSCFVHGILNVINMYGLNRSNYLIIGLFCDRTMTMNVIRYFRNHPVIRHGLSEIYFRTKDIGGWPGGVRLVENNGEIHDLPNTERMKVKDYFQPERCLYCLDKLNVYADISAGDNYTGRNSSIEGSNSLIIRTEEGMRIWRKIEQRFEVHEALSTEIEKSQHIPLRKDNYFFSLIKGKEVGIEINKFDVNIPVPKDIQAKYRRKLRLLRLGENYGLNPKGVIRAIRTQKLRRMILKVIRRITRMNFPRD